MGDLEGLFIASEEDVNTLIGKQLYFGEVLGKHSEVYGSLDKDDVDKVPVDPDVVAVLKGHLGRTLSGFNPLEYEQDGA
jgi:hypothetical protein